MNHFRYIFTILIAVLISTSCLAQPGRGQQRGQREDRKEAIEARRVSYITQKLSLTVDEAKLFWPIYNEYTRQVEELAVRFREQQDQVPDIDGMTEQQAMQHIEAELSRFERSAALRREYTSKLLDVVSAKQVALLFEAERSFHRMLFREAQHRRRPDGPGDRD